MCAGPGDRAQEIGGHTDMFSERGGELIRLWLRLALGDLSNHDVRITGPYVAMMRKDVKHACSTSPA